MNENYIGRIPETNSRVQDPWKDLVTDRYSVASLLCKDKKVLDSCCGTGWATMKYLAPIASSVTGFDMCEEMNRTNTAPPNCTFKQMDATNISLPGEKFDVVLALDSIEHFTYEDSHKYLTGLSDLCAHNGIVFGSTPLVIHESLKPIFLEWNKYHLYMYTKDDLEKQLKRTFSQVELFELYNPVCPYFIFICSADEEPISAEKISHIKNFILDNLSTYKRSWIKSHFFWFSRLLKKGMLKAACVAFFDMFSQKSFLCP